ncbi:MAG: MATE family efflux transporter [Gracilibacteraceae bacterium]|jgi:putative MATE family efflux protein|nr:MATE family efflux transporter [Gracilibacteraceae bacterium]
MEYTNPLGEEKIPGLLVKYSVPAIVGMIVNSLYNIVDRIFIGNSSDLGTYGLAGITIGFPIMIILLSIGLLFGVGGATLFSIKLGEGQPEEADRALGNAFSLMVISGVIFMIMGQILLRPLLTLFGASEAVLPYSVEYMRVIFFGAVFQVIGIGMNNFIRADGSPQIAMLTMFLGAGINTLLDPLFIYVFKMGMTGAALATILAQFISTIWIVAYFTGKRSKHKLKREYIKLKLSTVITITSLGIPGFALQLANSLLNAILNKSLLIYGGDIAVSGMGIINSLQTIFFMPVVGIKQGVQPIISFNYGSRKFNRVKEAVKLAVISATAIVVFGYVITRLFPKQIISIFNRDPELIKFGSYGLISWFLCMPVVGFQIIASNFFQAIGKYRSAMFLTLTRQVIFLIPALIIFPKFWGINGLLHAAPFADFFSALLTGIWFFYGIKAMSANLAEGIK